MNRLGKLLGAFLLPAVILLQSCASTTIIQTIPPGASVSVNNEYVGISPCAYTDKRISFSTNYVSIKMDGYEDFNAEFERSEDVEIGAVIGAVCFIPVFGLPPILWALKYKPSRTYDLTPKKTY